jgi:hypothetical protein
VELGTPASPLRNRVLSLITRSAWNPRFLSLTGERNFGQCGDRHASDACQPGNPAEWRGYSANRPVAALHQARNDFGKTGYSGPCPPKEAGTHHYHFRLLAISRPTLDLQAPAAGLDVLKAAQPYVIQQAELLGTYHRQTVPSRRRGEGLSVRNNLPLVRVGLIDLFLLDKYRIPGLVVITKPFISTNVEFARILPGPNCLVPPTALIMRI